MTFQARAVIVAGEARAKSLQAVAEALGGAQVIRYSFKNLAGQQLLYCPLFCNKCHSMFH